MERMETMNADEEMAVHFLGDLRLSFSSYSSAVQNRAHSPEWILHKEILFEAPSRDRLFSSPEWARPLKTRAGLGIFNEYVAVARKASSRPFRSTQLRLPVWQATQ